MHTHAHTHSKTFAHLSYRTFFRFISRLLTLRLDEVFSGEGVPVFLVLQTRRIKVLADDVQVNVTVKRKTDSVCDVMSS